jgi:predicted aminopeptidase
MPLSVGHGFFAAGELKVCQIARTELSGCRQMNRNSKIRHVKKWLPCALLLAGIAAFSGCRTAGYYSQAVRGQCWIITHTERIDKLIANPQTPAQLRQKLELVQQLRAFAGKELKLPATNYYRRYVDVHRPYVVWNVQAAGEFSLEPKTWWYPIVGSLEYRGYFSESGAQACAARIRAKGCDVCVDGIEAYSTLGWFNDPVLNTFIGNPEPELAETIFHELAHQRLFAPGDTDFNEAYATTVGQEGARRWLRAKGDTNACDKYEVSLRRNDQFVHLILDARRRLEKFYGDTRDKEGNIQAAKKPVLPPDQLRREKQRVLDGLRRDYEKLRAEWGGDALYDDWFAHELNNARLNTIANYYDFMPAFERLLELNGGNLEKFYQAVERLAGLPEEERRQRLRGLAFQNPETGYIAREARSNL